MSRIIAILLSETVYIETLEKRSLKTQKLPLLKHKSCGFETHSLKKKTMGFFFSVYPWFLTSWFFSTLPAHG